MNRKNIIIFILVASLAAIYWGSLSLQDYFQETVSFLQKNGSAQPFLSAMIFISLSALSAMFLGFSSIWLVPVAVVLWSNSLTVILLLFSWMIGAIISYFIGSYGGYPIVKKFISAEKLASYEHLILERLSFWIIFVFRFTLPSEIPGYILGIAKYPFAKYLLVTLLAEAPYAVYAVYAINSIIDKDKTIFIITAVIWIISGWLLAYLYNKKIKENGVNGSSDKAEIKKVL